MADKDRTPSIAIIGAGFSGICTAVQLQRKLNIFSFTLYDEQEEVGGTWFQNTYPGCECDIPSFIYSYSFEPNNCWTKFYPGQKEILDYLKYVAKKHQLYEKIKFQRKVISAEWKEKSNQWVLKICNLKSNDEELHAFDMIVIATGALRKPNKPDIFDQFSKTKMHSAEWDSSTDLNDKVVAVVGTGASAAQIISSVVDKVKKLIVYQRHPPWVIPKLQVQIPKVIQWLLEFIPGGMRVTRNFLFWAHDLIHQTFTENSWKNRIGKCLATCHLNRQVDDMEKRKILSATDDFGCKRILMSNTYFSDLSKTHVSIITSEIVEVSEDTLYTKDGSYQTPDVLITATGFKTQEYFAPLLIKGRNEENLGKKWQCYGPQTYLGIVCHSAPNAFFILGPNSILAHNSTVAMIEHQVRWMTQVIEEMLELNKQKFTVTSTAEMEYMEFINESMKSKVWGKGSCTSWYTNKAGDATILWPESLKLYYNRTVRFIPSDCVFE